MGRVRNHTSLGVIAQASPVCPALAAGEIRAKTKIEANQGVFWIQGLVTFSLRGHPWRRLRCS